MPKNVPAEQHELEVLNTESLPTATESATNGWIWLGCFDTRHEDPSSWEPSFWKKCCSLTICPTYKRVANTLSIILISLLLWGIAYSISPNLGRSSGNLIILTVSAYIGGLLVFKITSLPALIGMLLIGILFQYVGWIHFEGEFPRFNSELRKMALVIILTRAGLSLDQPVMKKMFLSVLKLGLIPWLAECITIGMLGHYILSVPWDWAFLLSCIIASVSPAVIVPSFIRFQQKGYGVDKGIPTLILASATIDDTLSIAVYGIISSIMFTESSLMNTILQGPISIVGGIVIGICWGYVVSYLPERSDSFINSLRVILLFLGGYISVSGSNAIGYAGIGPLSVVSASIVASHNWMKQGWNMKDNPVSSAFRISWILFEPILFALTGSQIKLHELDSHFIGIGSGCLFVGVIVRIVVTIVICFGSNFNNKEKFFIGLSWMAKATVQAALGPLALETVKNNNGTRKEMEYAKILLTICTLSIILTAPIGAILIAISGRKLLTKTKPADESTVGNCIEDNTKEGRNATSIPHSSNENV